MGEGAGGLGEVRGFPGGKMGGGATAGLGRGGGGGGAGAVDGKRFVRLEVALVSHWDNSTKYYRLLREARGSAVGRGGCRKAA